MDYDIGIDLKDPDFQDKIVEHGRHDILAGYMDGLLCVFFESVVSGWLQRVLCALLVLLAYFGQQMDTDHPIMGPLLGFAVANLLPFSVPTSSLLLNIMGRLAGVLLLRVIPLMRARVADRKMAFLGTFLLQMETVVTLIVMLTFRLSFRLGIFICLIVPAVCYFIVPLTQIYMAVVKRLPYPLRWLIVLPVKVYDICNRWLQYRMFPSLYRFLDRIEHDRLQDASKSLARHPIYQYTPLTSRGYFRVLVVERRRLFQLPRCRLEVESLDSSSAHIACSYVWGDATRSKKIFIDRHCLDVTESAYNVVRHQQSFLAERRIWIDAICINQADVKEKAVQIEHMGQIYGHALWVDAYLKFGNDDCDLWVLISDLLHKDVMHQAFGNTDHDLMYQEHLRPYWDQLFDLLASQWFNRMWVMQEIMLAGDLHLYYGQVKLTWPQLRSIVESTDTAVLRGMFAARHHLGQEHTEGSDIFTPLHLVITRRILKKHPESLYTLLRFFRRQKASDPRDKIYALLSLAPYNVRTYLGPAYQITLRELLTRTMRYLIQKEGLICLLSCHHEPDHPLANHLPSWVVNWCAEGKSLGQHDIPSWRAATRVPARPCDLRMCPIDSRMLPVRMMPIIDRVGETVIQPVRKDLISIQNADKFNVEFHAWLTKGREIVLRSSTRTDPESLEQRKRAFYRTLTYDHEDADNETTLQWSHPDFQSDIDFLEDWFNVGGDFADSRLMHDQRRLERMLQPLAKKTDTSIRDLRQEILRGNFELFEGLNELPQDDEDEDQDRNPKAYPKLEERKEDVERNMKIQERLRFSFGRRTGVTISGRVGSFPKDAHEGDEICLIAGAPAPFVVRRVVAEPDSNLRNDKKDGDGGQGEVQGYQLVGWCYLHGGMDGGLATGPWTDTYLI